MIRWPGPGSSGGSADSSADAEDTPLVGTTVADKYVIESRIGAGGMARVYRARQKVLDREVAVKVLRPPISSGVDRETFDRMFLQEAAAAAKLKSPHSITLYDFGQADDGLLFLVMEFLEGRTLRQVVGSGGRMAGPRAVHVAIQVCRSLREAHEKGLVHRDLKPENVMLVDRNNDPDFVKVLDFGIVKDSATRDENDDLSLVGRFVGSPRFASPEQLQNRADVDHRADIYSLGLLLYFLLAGEAPFVGSPRELLHKHLLEAPQPLDERELQIPDELAAAVYRCLEKDPGRRYPDMTAVIRALGRVEFPTGENEPAITEADMADFAAEIELDETDDALRSLRSEQRRRHPAKLASPGEPDDEPTDELAAVEPVPARDPEVEESTVDDLMAGRRSVPPLVWILAAMCLVAVVIVGLLFAPPLLRSAVEQGSGTLPQGGDAVDAGTAGSAATGAGLAAGEGDPGTDPGTETGAAAGIEIADEPIVADADRTSPGGADTGGGTGPGAAEPVDGGGAAGPAGGGDAVGGDGIPSAATPPGTAGGSAGAVGTGGEVGTAGTDGGDAGEAGGVDGEPKDDDEPTPALEGYKDDPY